MLEDHDRSESNRPLGQAESARLEAEPAQYPEHAAHAPRRVGGLEARRILSPILGAVTVLVLGGGVLVLAGLGAGAVPPAPTATPGSDSADPGQGAAIMSTVVAFRMAAASAPQVARVPHPTVPPGPTPGSVAIASLAAASPTAAAKPATTATSRPSLTPASPTPARTPTSPATSSAAPVRRSIIFAGGADANLRSSPSVDADVVMVLEEGTEVAELGQETTESGRVWKKIRTANGTEGWIVDDLLVQALPTPTATPRP